MSFWLLRSWPFRSNWIFRDRLWKIRVCLLLIPMCPNSEPFLVACVAFFTFPSIFWSSIGFLTLFFQCNGARRTPQTPGVCSPSLDTPVNEAREARSSPTWTHTHSLNAMYPRLAVGCLGELRRRADLHQTIVEVMERCGHLRRIQV